MGVGTYVGFLDAVLTWDLQHQQLYKSDKRARYKKTVTGSLSPRCLDVNRASLSPQPERLGAELELTLLPRQSCVFKPSPRGQSQPGGWWQALCI